MATTLPGPRPAAPTHRRRARRGEGELLRGQILAAAKDLLRETGDVEAVSVRSVAERVGVSTPSIYLHFADKAALIDAVCQDVFTELDLLMEAAAAAEPDPFTALRARGVAYVRFALANPEHYRIVMMTLQHGTERAAFDHDEIVDSPAYHHLRDGVLACQQTGVYGADTDPDVIASSLWASAHGAVSLALTKPGLAPDPVAWCEYVITVTGMGLAVASHHPELIEMCASGSPMAIPWATDPPAAAGPQAEAP